MLPSNRRPPRTTKSKKAPFVVVEGIDSSGKTTHVEAIANALAHLHYSGKVITFPNSLTPLGRFSEAYFAEGIAAEMLDSTYLVSLHRWEMVDGAKALFSMARGGARRAVFGGFTANL